MTKQNKYSVDWTRRRFLAATGGVFTSSLFGATLFGNTYSKESFNFSGPISRAVLKNYLSRAITEMSFLYEENEFDENLRFIKNIGAKFIGRALCCWGDERWIFEHKEVACQRTAKVWDVDPDIILQACIFEIITKNVNQVHIPPHVFETYGLPIEDRCFRYEDMLSDWGRNYWTQDQSVPDIEQLETQMWFYAASTAYIDAGCESLHLGQVDLMSKNRPQLWEDFLKKVRAYASEKARRQWVLCDGHVTSHGLVVNGQLLLDFHSFPLRIKEVENQPQKGILEMNWLDTIYGKSAGGVTPSGWTCEHLPYLVEIDNFGSQPKEIRGKSTPNSCFVWGFDEIDWFANQTEEYRNEWLAYADHWLETNDPDGHLQMPGRRCLADPNPGIGWVYRANTRSDAAPNGLNQEETIKQIWNDNPLFL